MKTIYIITTITTNLLTGEMYVANAVGPFNTYPEAEQLLANLPTGQYQIQKIFINE